MNDDFKVPDDVQEELDRLRGKNRFYTYVFVGIVTVGLLAGTALYAKQQADAEAGYYNNYYKAAYTSTGGDTSGSDAAAGGGGCGGGAAGSSGGCGGGSAGSGGSAGGCGGGSLLKPGGPTLADLEKQGLAAYTKETGKKDVTAKAKNFGCHIQVDIADGSGSILRSYGYKGEALYVIK